MTENDVWMLMWSAVALAIIGWIVGQGVAAIWRALSK